MLNGDWGSAHGACAESDTDWTSVEPFKALTGHKPVDGVSTTNKEIGECY